MNPPAFQIRLLGDERLCNEFVQAFAPVASFLQHLDSATTGDLLALGVELTIGDAHHKHENLAALDAALPSPVPILSNTLVFTLAEQSRWIAKPRRLMGIGLLPSGLSAPLVEGVRSSSTLEETLQKSSAFFSLAGKELVFVGDTPGLVLPRIRSMILNEAFYALAEKVAAPSDIDLAMRLGTHYPTGPFEWGERVGLENVLAILEALESYYGDERYRPAPLLREAGERQRNVRTE